MERAINKIMDLGYRREDAEEMLSTFKREGGLICEIRWPGRFSWFAPGRNVLDVLQEEGLV